MSKKQGPVTTDEMIEVLEDIVRTSTNAPAKIAAIRQLRELRAEAGAAPRPAETAAAADDFDALDELAPRRRVTATG